MRDAWSRFWDGFTITGMRLAVLRFFFFGVLALDCWSQIEHAPRYGAGGLNVSHFPALDGLLPLPDRHWVLGAYLAQAYLALRIALGGSTRFALPALTGLWGYTYFCSQLDSYQHHYLIFLALLAFCFVPWDGTRERPEEPRPAWGIRLLLVQMSLLYFWTAVAKVDPHWLSGETLASQVSEQWVREWFQSFALALGTDVQNLWAVAAVAVTLGEFAVSAGLQIPRLALPTLILGVSFHVGVEVLGFKIGLFSYFMLTLYLLLMPAGVIRRLYRLGASLPSLPGSAIGTPALVIALVAGGGAVASLPLEAPGLAAVLVTVAALLLEPRDTGEDRDRRAVLHIAACAGLLLFHHNTDQLRDYYRYLGGDTRRRGELVEATAAYLQVTRIDPTYGSGFYRLGDLYYRQGDYEAAAAPLARARKLMPGEWQVHLRAAQTYLKLDRPEEAVDAARAVLKLKPDEPTAKKIVTRYAEKDG